MKMVSNTQNEDVFPLSGSNYNDLSDTESNSIEMTKPKIIETTDFASESYDKQTTGRESRNDELDQDSLTHASQDDSSVEIECKPVVSDEDLALRRRELAAEAAAEIKRENDLKLAALEKLFMEESEKSATREILLDEKADGHISESPEVREEEPVVEAASKELKHSGSILEEEENVGQCIRTKFVESLQETGDSVETEEKNEENTSVENETDAATNIEFIRRPRLEQGRGLSMRNLCIEMSMSNLSFGPTHVSNPVKGDLLDFETEELSFDEDEEDRKMRFEQGISKADMDLDKQKVDHATANEAKLTSTISASSSNDQVPKEPNVTLSDVQMLQSIKMAIEADRRGLTEFHTCKHLDELENVAVLSMEEPPKRFRLRRRSQKRPKLEKEKSKFGSRVGNMMKRASDIFSFRKNRGMNS